MSAFDLDIHSCFHDYLMYCHQKSYADNIDINLSIKANTYSNKKVTWEIIFILCAYCILMQKLMHANITAFACLCECLAWAFYNIHMSIGKVHMSTELLCWQAITFCMQYKNIFHVASVLTKIHVNDMSLFEQYCCLLYICTFSIKHVIFQSLIWSVAPDLFSHPVCHFFSYCTSYISKEFDIYV